MELFVGKFEGSDVRYVKINKALLFEAHDISKALRFENPRREVVKVTVETRCRTELVKWEDNTEIFVVDYSFVIDLALRAENEISRKLILWMIKISAAEVAREVVRESALKDSISEEQALNETVFTVSQIGALFGMSGVELNRILNKSKIQRKVNGQWILAAKYSNMNLVRTQVIKKNDTERYLTVWTDHGVQFIRKHLYMLGYTEQPHLDLTLQGGE